MDRATERILDRPVGEARSPSPNGLGLRSGLPDESSAPLYWVVVRDLQEGEEARLTATSLGVKPIPLAKVREIHHQIARLLAQGLRPVEVSAIVGFSQSRISILQQDPSFKELLSFYRHRKDEVGADIAARLQSVTLDALAILHERLLDDPDAISTDELQKAVNSGLDRLGHGARQTLDVNFIGAAVLARLKASATEEGAVRLRSQGQEQDQKEKSNQASQTVGSPGPIIDVPESDLVSSPLPTDPLGDDGDPSAKSCEAPAKGRTPGGTPI
jgi:hypothetical protein